MINRFASTIREAGLFLSGIGLGILFTNTEWLRSETTNTLAIGSLLILGGNFLRLFRSEKEKAEENRKKREQYSRITRKFGVSRVIFAHKASIIGTLALFSVAMITMLSGSMNMVWPIICVIAILLVIAVYTDDPNRSIFEENSNQPEQDKPITRP